MFNMLYRVVAYGTVMEFSAGDITSFPYNCLVWDSMKQKIRFAHERQKTRGSLYTMLQAVARGFQGIVDSQENPKLGPETVLHKEYQFHSLATARRLVDVLYRYHDERDHFELWEAMEEKARREVHLHFRRAGGRSNFIYWKANASLHYTFHAL